MNQEQISGEDQRLILEKIGRSDDSITATNRFNRDKETNLGDARMDLKDLGRTLKKAGVKSHRAETAIKDVTGHDIDIDKL